MDKSTQAHSVLVRCAPVASPVDKFAEIASPVAKYASPANKGISLLPRS